MIATKIVFVLVCFYFLPTVVADALANVTILTESPKYIDNTITLDDLVFSKLPWYLPPAGFSMNITVEERQQEFSLRGMLCSISKGFTLMEARWDGSKAWIDSNNETFPGLFIGSSYYSEGDNCTLYFKEPIAQFAARVNTEVVSTQDLNSTKSIIQILDINGDEISTANIPKMSGLNNYTILGFSSKTPIYSVVLTNAINVMDDVQWTFYYCKEGFFRDIDGECKDINECETDPCSSVASCINAEGSFNCTCNHGYIGDGLGTNGCQDIDECLASNSTCGSNAYCNNTIGGFECTCIAGMQGNPYASKGCSEIVVSVTPPVQAPISHSEPRPQRLTRTSSSVVTTWCLNVVLLVVFYLFA